ncbi:hypothetical protein [Rummeliibacillus stabekisii]|uniref:hypothetical protein n=1 Tax=Rummeliibacillus stabekisii TaxID=241244 RepID=UPI003718C339
MGAYTFRRARERLAAKNHSYEQLNAMKISQIKGILDSKHIDYKSNGTKKELISYLVEIPEEQPGSEVSDNDGDDS